jgi:predicted MPP superfamily phosphohydrolase
LRIRNYSVLKETLDRIYTVLTPAQWPARLAWRLRPWEVAVEEHAIAVPRLAGTELRIAFASDFHAGAATPWPLLEAAAERLDGLRADLLLLGGDFVSIGPEGAGRVARLLAGVHAPLGRFAVLGNHDHWAGGPAIVRQLEDAGIEMVTNRSVALPPPFADVSVCGLDDYTSGDPQAAAAFANARAVRVVLMHAPSGLLDIGDERFDVAFCGHTHGGQIARADGSPVLVASGPLSGRYNAGRYPVDGRGTLLVSRGVGCGTLPIRWNSPSSVFLCRLGA